MYLVGFRISGGLGIFSLFDIFHHFPYEGVAVVLILGHDNLKDKPQSLFNFFELLNVLYFDVVRVMCQQVDGVGHHIFRQQREQLVCGRTQDKYYTNDYCQRH